MDLSTIARILALPATQQQAVWRTWAIERADDDRQRVALSMLARRADPSDASIVIDAFEQGTPKVRGVALRASLVFGPELSVGSRDRLWSAVLNAPKRAPPELIWALVTAKDPRIYERALDEYAHRGDSLASVKTIGGTSAFDAALIGALNLERTLRLAQDHDPRLRLLVAETCSRVAQTECTPWLMRLVRDSVAQVSAAAAPGLVKIGSVETHEAVTHALRAASEEQRARLLRALRDETGLAGLVAALDSVSPDLQQGLTQSAAIFAAILGAQSPRTALDPRGSDALHEYMQHAPHLYSRTWAAIALARLGDLRGLPALAERLRLTPNKAYSGDTAFELNLRRSDTEREVIANTLLELADAYPENLNEIRKVTEEALLVWLSQPKLVHPSALQALAKMRSPATIPRLRNWASLAKPLPKATDDMTALFRHDWGWASASLWSLGLARDGTSMSVLKKSLRRRPKDLDLTTHGLSADPNHPRGIALRLLASGAINGIAEMGDSRGAESLFIFADDPLENEVNRVEACRALGWVATESDREKVLARLNALRTGAHGPDARLHCFLETFAFRAAGDFKPALLRLLDDLSQSADLGFAFLVARALGRIGLVESDEGRVLALLQRDDQGALPAALALLVGARQEMAQLAVLRMLGRPESQLSQLKTAYAETIAYLSDEDLSTGALYRWVSNAFAVEQAGAIAVRWPREALAQRLEGLPAQYMPRPMSSLQFRTTSYDRALDGNSAAIESLLAAGEGGALLAASETPGPSSHAAYLAYRRLLAIRDQL